MDGLWFLINDRDLFQFFKLALTAPGVKTKLDEPFAVKIDHRFSLPVDDVRLYIFRVLLEVRNQFVEADFALCKQLDVRHLAGCVNRVDRLLHFLNVGIVNLCEWPVIDDYSTTFAPRINYGA